MILVMVKKIVIIIRHKKGRMETKKIEKKRVILTRERNKLVKENY